METYINYSDRRSWFYESFMPSHPSISELLFTLAEDARLKSEDVHTEERLVEKPKAISSETLFVRSLYSICWRDTFGGPLYNTFAAFSNVVFGYSDDDTSALTAAKVRKALK